MRCWAESLSRALSSPSMCAALTNSTVWPASTACEVPDDWLPQNGRAPILARKVLEAIVDDCSHARVPEGMMITLRKTSHAFACGRNWVPATNVSTCRHLYGGRFLDTAAAIDMTAASVSSV